MLLYEVFLIFCVWFFVHCQFQSINFFNKVKNVNRIYHYGLMADLTGGAGLEPPTLVVLTLG